MRILLIDHLSPEDATAENELFRLAQGLRRQTHETVCLVADRQVGEAREGMPVHRVVFREGEPAADAPFELPALAAGVDGRPAFRDLSDRQVATYREALRRRLDRVVVAFDPQVIHVRHTWLLGHLAMETGVPYVLGVRGPELRAYQEDPRSRHLVDDAVACAAGIVAEDEAIGRQFAQLFSHVEHRPVVSASEEGDERIARLAAIYASVLLDRFGS